MNPNNFVILILKGTEILKNTESNNKQLLFWLKKIPFNKESNGKSYFKKLLNSFILNFFSDNMLTQWKCQFSDKDLLKSLVVTLLTSFETIDREGNKKNLEILHAKISLLDISLNSWEVFVTDVLKTMDNKYGFNNIKNINSFKISINFKSEVIKDFGFISGKLVDAKLDKHNKLILLPITK